jgi:hypothetical protein
MKADASAEENIQDSVGGGEGSKRHCHINESIQTFECYGDEPKPLAIHKSGAGKGDRRSKSGGEAWWNESGQDVVGQKVDTLDQVGEIIRLIQDCQVEKKNE